MSDEAITAEAEVHVAEPQTDVVADVADAPVPDDRGDLPTESSETAADSGTEIVVESEAPESAAPGVGEVTGSDDGPEAEDDGSNGEPGAKLGSPDALRDSVSSAASAAGSAESETTLVDIDGSDEVDAEGEDAEPEEDDTYELPRILAIANQKGGVGKTTTSVNLGASLAELGYRVLVVDLDPQGNATTGLGVNARELNGSIYDVIMNDAAIEDCVEPTALKNLFVAPATIDLAGAEIELVPAFSRELKLRRALHEIRDDYDYMIIDCPPSLGLLTVNGLAAADDVIVPIQCEYYALEGLSQLIRNVSLVQKNLNPSLDVRGIVLTMYDARTKLADQVEQEVRKHFGRTVYQTVVPRTVRLSEAPSFGQPIIVFDPTSRGAVAYRELAKEVSSGATRRTG
jgi:chromosome partitioning protein